jgi:hypothetical protein
LDRSQKLEEKPLDKSALNKIKTFIYRRINSKKSGLLRKKSGSGSKKLQATGPIGSWNGMQSPNQSYAKRMKMDQYLISHMHPARIRWDLFIIALAIYNSISLPL